MPSLNPIIFTPLGVIVTHFLFFLPSFDRSHKWTRILMQICAGVPFNIWLQVLIVLRWPRPLPGNKQRDAVSQNFPLLTGVLVRWMKRESHILDTLSACRST